MVLACNDRTLALSHVNMDVDSSMLKASSSSLHREEALHAGVACEVCRVSPIEGVRYSCTVRKRYDKDKDDDDMDDDDDKDDDNDMMMIRIVMTFLPLLGSMSAVHASR